MSKIEKCILTNMCMIYDNDGNVLVQDKIHKEWGGVTFPGGHIKKNEALVDSVIREIKEETGLTIKSPKLCGVKQFEYRKGIRYIVFFYKTNEFEGELKSSREGKVFWVKADEVKSLDIADDFDDMFDIFMNDDLQEFQWVRQKGEWIKKIL